MKHITVLFDKNWIRSEEYKKLPARHIEKQILSNTNAKLISSNRTKMIFVATDEEAEVIKKVIFDTMRKDYSVNDPDVYVSFIIADYEDEDEHPQDCIPETAKNEEKESESKDVSETKSEEPNSQKSTESNASAVNENRPMIRAFTERVEEVMPAYDFEQLLEDAPMKHSEDLKNYLRETKAVIPVLKEMGNEACIWSQNLLVSIDTGFGLTTFLKTLVKVHILEGLVENKQNVSCYFAETTLESDEKAWSRLILAAEKCEDKAQRARHTVLCIDISEYIDDILAGKQVNYLKQLADISKHYICVFRVPYMEHSVVNDIASALSNVMNVRSLCVSPVHIEDMVEYMRNRLLKKGIESDDSVNEMLERQLMQEKFDDSFFGYKTLNKVIDKVIYDKAVKNANEGIISKTIEKNDIIVSTGKENDIDPENGLKDLVGMEQIMEQVDMMIAQMTELKKQRDRGANIEKPAIHMMFTGNPGTGKTTVARLVAKILKQKGILRKGHVFEYKGRDLCGRYIGETAPKTSAICRDAYGSVLFIDEAYSLFRGEDSSDKDYGREALDTLVAEMENHRDDMCIILAGYTDEMNTMLEGNRGLRSRIPYVIDFPNYSREQLSQIFFKMLDNKFAYDKEFEVAVNDFFNALPDSVFDSKQFSNARFVRNLYEKVWGKAAYRKNMNNEEELVLLKSDLENAANSGEYKHLLEKKNNKKIGFI